MSKSLSFDLVERWWLPELKTWSVRAGRHVASGKCAPISSNAGSHRAGKAKRLIMPTQKKDVSVTSPADAELPSVGLLSVPQHGYASLFGRMWLIKDTKPVTGTRYVALSVDGDKAAKNARGYTPMRGAVISKEVNVDFTKLLGVGITEGDVVEIVVCSLDLEADMFNGKGLVGNEVFQAVDFRVIASQLTMSNVAPYRRAA
jgi:hypothetical protein